MPVICWQITLSKAASIKKNKTILRQFPQDGFSIYKGPINVIYYNVNQMKMR